MTVQEIANEFIFFQFNLPTYFLIVKSFLNTQNTRTETPRVSHSRPFFFCQNQPLIHFIRLKYFVSTLAAIFHVFFYINLVCVDIICFFTYMYVRFIGDLICLFSVSIFLTYIILRLNPSHSSVPSRPEYSLSNFFPFSLFSSHFCRFLRILFPNHFFMYMYWSWKTEYFSAIIKR